MRHPFPAFVIGHRGYAQLSENSQNPTGNSGRDITARCGACDADGKIRSRRPAEWATSEQSDCLGQSQWGV